MGTQITRLTRLAAAGLSAVLLFATAACAATSPAETEPDNKSSVPAPTGPINVVASLNQWGSLAAELGGDDVEVTSIVNSTNVDAHDFEPKTSDVAKLSKAQIIVANGAGYDSWATKSMTKTTNIVSAASVMGAMEGDNPHLWFSKDARSSMATPARRRPSRSGSRHGRRMRNRWKHGRPGSPDPTPTSPMQPPNPWSII